MIKLIFASILIALLYPGCNTAKIPSHEKLLMEIAVQAILKYDTAQIFNLFDTSFCFKVNSKEGFIDKINYIHSHLLNCNCAITDSNVTIKHTRVRTMEYDMTFCNGSGTTKSDEKFTMRLEFADEEKKDKILFLDILNDVKNIKPIAPLPKGG